MSQEWLKNVQDRIKGIPRSSGRSNKWGRVGFDDLIFVPAQLFKRPVDCHRQEINTETIVGKNSQKPVKIKIPVIIGAMSFGALSKEAKISLAKGSSLAGTMANTGEGGMLDEEREFAKRLIIQYSTGRFGITEDVLKKADAIEIKIGQGAKPGSGGLLPKDKVTDEIAKVRNIEKECDVYSPPYHSDIKTVDDLKNKVVWLKELTGGVPVIIKMGAGNIEKDIEIASQTQADVIAIDGGEGGTGASPKALLDEVGVPTLAALARARKALKGKELWIGGGIVTGADIAKALAIGADAVFMGTPFLVSMGCTYCRQCYLGKCPKGVATQDPLLRKNLDIELSANNISNYLKNCIEEVKIIAGAVGKSSIYDFEPEDLRALTSEAAKIANIDFIA